MRIRQHSQRHIESRRTNVDVIIRTLVHYIIHMNVGISLQIIWCEWWNFILISQVLAPSRAYLANGQKSIRQFRKFVFPSICISAQGQTKNVMNLQIDVPDEFAYKSILWFAGTAWSSIILHTSGRSIPCALFNTTRLRSIHDHNCFHCVNENLILYC